LLLLHVSWLRRNVVNSFHVALKPGLSSRPVRAKLTTVRLLALVHGRHVDGEVVLLAEPLVAQLASIGTVLLVHRLHVLLEVVFPLEPVRADGADVRLGAVRLLHDWRLVSLHDVCSKVVSLQEALVTKMAAKRFDLKLIFLL
jgi:hypothetical protein